MDEQLRFLWQETLKAPQKSRDRARSMSRLLSRLQRLPNLRKASHLDYSSALSRTWEWVSENIEQFQPSSDSLEADFTRWINGYLNWRVRDLYSARSDDVKSLDQVVRGDGQTLLDRLDETGSMMPSLSGLDKLIEDLQKQKRQSLGLKVEDYIKADPEQVLRSCFPKSNSDCNCHILSLRVLVNDPPDSFTVLSKELGIPYQSLISHWKRKCLVLLRDFAEKQNNDQGEL
ncbi:hypothetical protein ACQ4M3_34285 [Leptolyngbya sp. AN03gr2]|uniref:hypothetical protein n=1 Tax=unclassified Leptolyngbya TaxID=2650499 RepID=UPI003D323782